MKKIFFLSLLASLTLLLTAQETETTKPLPDQQAEAKNNENQDAKETKEDLAKLKFRKTFYDQEEKKLKTETPYYLKNEVALKHGMAKAYYPSGKVYIEQQYHHDKKNGIEKHFTEAGKLEKEILWENDNRKVYKTFYEDSGKPKYSIQIKDGKKNGLEEYYYDNGTKKVQIHWSEDKKFGLETYWYENGKKKYQLNWEFDSKQGEEIHWFESGIVSSKTIFKDGKPNEKMILNYENGKAKAQLEWNMGVLVNERIHWNSKGEITAKCTYENGNPLNGSVFDSKELVVRYYEKGSLAKTAICDSEGNLTKVP